MDVAYGRWENPTWRSLPENHLHFGKEEPRKKRILSYWTKRDGSFPYSAKLNWRRKEEKMGDT